MCLDFSVVNMERAQRSICLRLDAYERLYRLRGMILRAKENLRLDAGGLWNWEH